MEITCPKCHTVNSDKNIFCISCGSKIQELSAFTPQAPVQPAVPPPMQGVPPPPPPAPIPAAVAPPPPPVYAAPPQPVQQAPAPQMVQPKVAPPPPAPKLSGLGVSIEGASDILDGEADKAQKVIDAFIKRIQALALPGVTLDQRTLTEGSDSRLFQIVRHSSGASVAVNIQPFGKDLYTGWDLYVPRKLNFIPCIVMAAIAVGVPFIYWLVNLFSGNNFFFVTLQAFFHMASLILPITILALLYGKLLHDDPWMLFVTELNDFQATDAAAFTMVVQRELFGALDDAGIELEEE